MITLLNGESIWTGFDMQTNDKILNRLAESGIKYKSHVTNLANDKRGLHGGDLFHAKDQLYQYDILVSRAVATALGARVSQAKSFVL